MLSFNWFSISTTFHYVRSFETGTGTGTFYVKNVCRHVDLLNEHGTPSDFSPSYFLLSFCAKSLLT